MELRETASASATKQSRFIQNRRDKACVGLTPKKTGKDCSERKQRRAQRCPAKGTRCPSNAVGTIMRFEKRCVCLCVFFFFFYPHSFFLWSKSEKQAKAAELKAQQDAEALAAKQAAEAAAKQKNN